MTVQLEFDSRVYRLNAVKKAAYKYADRLVASIAFVAPDMIQVTLSARAEEEDLGGLAADFRCEVLDQELREVVAAETEPIRRILLAQAFSPYSLVDGLADSADFRLDPKGIGQGGTQVTAK